MSLLNNLDETDWHLLEALQDDARLSYSELGRRVGLSQPAAAERVRRLEEAGVLCSYRAEVDREKLGLPITAYIRLTLTDVRTDAFVPSVQKLDEVIECHRLTGEDCFILKVVATSISHLEEVIERLGRYGRTSTSIVLSSVITRRTFTRTIHIDRAHDIGSNGA